MNGYQVSLSKFAVNRFYHSIKHYATPFCCKASKKKNHENASGKTRMFDIRRFCLVFMQVGLRRRSTYVGHTLFDRTSKPGACKL